MFENLIAQSAGNLLIDDIASRRLPPSILFSGPSASGKLTAALELARVLSCLKAGEWTCDCPSCRRHKELAHPDLLIVGPKDCVLEIRAAQAAFLANRTQATRYLFVRSLRKLTLRFSQALNDREDSKFAKAAGYLADIEEYLEELSPARSMNEDLEALKKTVESAVATAEKLESECLWDSVPVSQVRNAASWARLSPSGKTKVLVVEQADRMLESSRNAFLKILEEPPASVVFVLTTSRRGAIMPTILSRVRTYAFVERDSKAVSEVVSRVFRQNPEGVENLPSFFYRFLPVPPETIAQTAALFLDMTLNLALDAGRRPLPSMRAAVDRALTGVSPDERRSANPALIIGRLNRCRPGILWHLFLSSLTDFMRRSLTTLGADSGEIGTYAAWTASIRKALDSVDVYNLGPASALESLALEMRDAC